MAIEVAKVELKNVQDASGMEAAIKKGQFKADEVIAVIGKTEGNGGVNDFTRILADQAFRAVLKKLGSRSVEEIATIPMVWSGGCDGVITPHATVFARNSKTGPADKSRLVIGTAMSAEIFPEDIGRPAMVEKVAEGVRAAMRNAGIDDPADVHYVQTKTPLLTVDSVIDAHSRGKEVACEVHDSMGVSNGTTGLGIAVGLHEIKMPKAEEICHNLNLYSSVASCSSGVELTQAQIVLLGNKKGAGGRYRIGHAVMKDALDIDGIYEFDPQRRARSAGTAARRRSERPAGELLHEMRGRPHRQAARPPPDHARRFRCAVASPRQGCGRRRCRGGNRRSGGVCFGRCDAPGAAGRRTLHRHHRRRRVTRVDGDLREAIGSTHGRWLAADRKDRTRAHDADPYQTGEPDRGA